MYVATWNGAVIAQSDKTIEIEGNQYFPSDAVNADARALIDAVSAAMSAEDLVALNVRSVDEKLSAAVIAREWLVSAGLLD